MKYKYLENSVISVPEDFFESLDAQLLREVESRIIPKGEGEFFNYGVIKKNLTNLMGQFEVRDRSDGIIAEMLHKHFPVSKRQAAHVALWHYCSLFEFMDYVKWRWHDAKTGKLNKDRFLGAWRRNALGRLWWWAEISHDPSLEDPYQFTKLCAVSQEFVLHAVDDFVGGEKDCLLFIAKILFKDGTTPDRNLVRMVFAKWNAVSESIALDGLSSTDKQLLVEDVVADAETGLLEKSQ